MCPQCTYEIGRSQSKFFSFKFLLGVQLLDRKSYCSLSSVVSIGRRPLSCCVSKIIDLIAINISWTKAQCLPSCLKRVSIAFIGKNTQGLSAAPHHLGFALFAHLLFDPLCISFIFYLHFISCASRNAMARSFRDRQLASVATSKSIKPLPLIQSNVFFYIICTLH